MIHKPAGREAAVFALRWIVIAALALVSFVQRSQLGLTMEPALLALIASCAVNLVLLPFAWVESLHPYAAPVALIGDGVIAGSFAYSASAMPLMLLIIAAGVMMPALVRVSFRWSAAQAAVVTASVALVAGAHGTWDADQTALVLLIALGIVTAATAFGMEQLFGELVRQMRAVSKDHETQSVVLRERTRAIYELAAAMSGAGSFERILEAALDAGRLGTRQPDQTGALIGMVLLFDAEDDALHVAASRRLMRTDEFQVIPGKAGLVGQALGEAEPVVGTQPSKDPELQYFTSLQLCKSVLVIPLRAGYENFGVIIYASERANAFAGDHRDVLTAIGLQTTIALQNSLLQRSLMEEKERIVEVEEEARKKLARDLHDGPTQSVAAIAMRMSYIQRLFGKEPDKVPEELKKAEEIARRTTKEIRHMLFTLRPLVLESQGLTAALQQLAEKMQETHGQAVSVRVGQDVESVLDRNQQGTIFYIIEEAVNNARKHAQAELISVQVARQKDIVVIQIADNGVGFEMSAVTSNYDQRGSLGMVNMRERAELLNGQLTVESMPGRGTVVRVIIPLRTALTTSATEPVSSLRRTLTREMPRVSASPKTKLAMAAADRIRRMEQSRS